MLKDETHCKICSSFEGTGTRVKLNKIKIVSLSLTERVREKPSLSHSLFRRPPIV